MSEIKINEELSLILPDRFQEMSPEEIKMSGGSGDESTRGFRNLEQHMILTAGWKKINGFSAMMLNAKDLAKGSEKAVSELMRTFQYQRSGFEPASVGGVDAYAYSYSYQAENVGMSGKTIVLKKNKTVYYFYFYFRTGSDSKMIDQIMDSAVWDA